MLLADMYQFDNSDDRSDLTGQWRLDFGDTTMVVASQAGAAPRLIYFGASLTPQIDLGALAVATGTQVLANSPDDGGHLTLWPINGWGFSGEAALVAGGAPDFILTQVHGRRDGLTLELECVTTRLRTVIYFNVFNNLLECRTDIINAGNAACRIYWQASLCLPLPDWAQVATLYGGRWSGEFRATPVPLFEGSIGRTGRGGRGGFGGASHVVIGEAGIDENRGRVLAAQLAWSGDARLMVESLPRAGQQLQMGMALGPEGRWLEPGAVAQSPSVWLGASSTGLASLRRAFHDGLRQLRRGASVGQTPRRVHFNSWEATYFDIDEARLMALADEAAMLGVERFVVDDGWFAGRCDDKRALGDWQPDLAKFPNGLQPIIAYVEALGMDFGLWIEPEMISPDSALYRAHPDWCIALPGRRRSTMRNQLMLELQHPDISDAVFGMIDKLLTENRIAYLKWDCNRDLFQTADAWRHVDAVNMLIDRVRAAHPTVEIEACASGGGRLDFATLARCERVWASDVTDPIERLRIHDLMGLFYPPEVIGAHVGASPNPITGRSASMLFRARAMLGAHMGVEADPGRMSAADRAVLAAEIVHWKAARALLADGIWSRLALGDGCYGWLCAAREGADALAMVASVSQSVQGERPRVRFHGLAVDRDYKISLVEPWPQPAARALGDPAAWRRGIVVDGRSLALVGLALPLSVPETAWLIRFERVDGQ